VAEVARLNSRLERNEDREGQLEEELGKVKYSVQKLLPQVFALQSKMTHITSPQVMEHPLPLGCEECKLNV
jgi:hypothetical protein